MVDKLVGIAYWTDFCSFIEQVSIFLQNGLDIYLRGTQP